MTRLSSPNRKLAAAVGGVLVVGAAAWAVGLTVRSPADAAAAHRAPTPSLVTAPVEKRALTATVLTRGTVQYGSPAPLVLAGAVGATDTGGGGESTATGQRVTRPPTVGQTVAEGAPVLEVNGRPVFVLAGPVPMYRTIGPGTKGPDVKQLQEALGRLGYLKGNADGVFGASTATAVQKWYQAKGYSAQEPTTAQTRELHSLQEAVQSATQAQVQAQTAAAAGGGAKKLLDLQLKAAGDNLANARSDLDKYQNQYGTSVPAGEVAFLPSLPVRMTDVAVKAGQNVDGKVATVTSSTLVIQANVTVDDAGLLRENMKAAVSTTDGKTTAGTVTAIGDKARLDTGETPSKDQKNDNPTAPTGGSGGDPVPGGAVPVLISLDDPGALANRDKAPVTVSVAVGSTADKVLVVPVSAVVTGADATSRVEADRGAGRTEDVPVTVGLAAGGYVQVTPSGAGLREGDRVVVGVR